MIKIGIIADVFTGATDAASFLSDSGNMTIMLTDISQNIKVDCDCLVTTLKVRSVAPDQAIKEVDKAMDLLENMEIDKIYFKYCSTFDSTPKGNIGVIMDHLLERMNIRFSILCPSLPVNGRTVKDGFLYVNGIPLAESPMKNHPLNPMWDSYIPALMSAQSRYPCFVPADDPDIYERHEHYYLVPDFADDKDGEMIAKKYGDLKLLSGGSGLLAHLFKNKNTDKHKTYEAAGNKTIILSGSCSKMTQRQVHSYKNSGRPYICIDPDDMISGNSDAKDIFKMIDRNQPETTLVYSIGCEKDITNDSRSLERSKILEELFADLAYMAIRSGYDRIIVAGGEISGTVIRKLNYGSFYIGKSIALGVPVLIPRDNGKISIILKSGNFGDDDFFLKALNQ